MLSLIGSGVFILNLIVIRGVNGSPVAFSVDEQQALLKIARNKINFWLRPMVEDDLYMEYMHEDVYLIPWLRISNLDALSASKTLRKAHQWRKANLIDRIITEDYSQLEKQLPYFIDWTDREGRPVITIPFGPKWDLRKQILAGNRMKFNLLLIRMNELAALKARQEFNSTASRDIPDWTLIVDMNGYNARQHACIPCVPAMVQFATDWDSYLPALTSAYAINTPRIFETVVRIFRPLLAERTKRAIHIYGTNKQEWSDIFRSIAPDQLRRSFGGTKI